MKKIFVIDDDPDILEAIRMILETENFDTKTSIKADNVKQSVVKYNPDLIILDILLSGNDGRAICRSLKQDVKTKHIPIIMISAHPSAKKSVKESGADCFVAKPFSIDSLLKEVFKCLK